MKNLKSTLTKIPLLLCIIIISMLCELIFFNYKLLFLDNNNRTININNYQEEIIDDKKIISFDLKNVYNNKLKITYKTVEDVGFSINYQGNNYYQELKEEVFNDKFDNEANLSVNNIQNNVGNIKITFNSKANINIESIQIDNKINLNLFRIFFISIIFIIIYIIYKFYKNNCSYEKIHLYFLIIGLLLGGTFIILQPSTTYYSWDDQIHFLNVYEMFDANGYWNMGEFSMIDSSPIGRDNVSSIEEQLNINNYLNVEKPGNYSSFKSRFITYNKIAYLPSAIGFHICNKLNLPFVICFKIGKFMNLLTYLLIFSYAIKISPSFKRLLVVLAFIPTNLFLATQYSYDPAVVAGLTLGIVLLTNVIFNKDAKVDFKFMLLFLLSMLYGCFPKAVYAPLLLLFLLIPKDKFKNNKQCNHAKIGIVIVTILMMATFVLPTVSSSEVAGDSRGGTTSVSEQLRLIISNPIGYVKVLKDTMGVRFIDNFIGKNAIGNFSYMNKISDNLYYIYLILLLVVGLSDNYNNDGFKVKSKIFGATLILGTILLIWTALYLSFTPVGLTTINGVQERYFLPLLLPVFLLIRSKEINLKFKNKIYNLAVLIIPSTIFLCSIFKLVLTKFCY